MKFKKSLIILILFMAFTMFGCIGTNINQEDLGLLSVGNATKLKELLKSSRNNYVGGIWRDGFFLESEKATDDLAPNSPSDSSNGSTDYTKTNVQVEGVDEGDIVKTDGRRIYSIKHDRLQVVGILENGQMEVLLNEMIAQYTNTQSYYSNTYYSDLYLTDRYLVVIGQKYEHFTLEIPKEEEPAADDDTEPAADDDTEPAADDDTEPAVDYYYSYRWTSMTVVQIYDIESLEKIDQYEVSGYVLTSRLIDNNLYLISNHYVYSYDYDREDFEPRPFIKHNDQITFVDYEEIKYLEEMQYQSFTVITNVKLNETVTYDFDVFLGASYWGQIYVSKNAIYLATTIYEHNLLGIYKEKGRLISYQFNPQDGSVIYGGAGDFLGYVINQFAMDEYNGYMRIVTTEGWGENTKNRLYVFERKLVENAYQLDVVGLIDSGLGKPRERVQSVRFNKDKATVVTFERTDPFYTIDLTDPTKPTIKGALEVPGFSTYQHPWTDNLVIGIGFDSDGTRTTGMKLSMYDITDFDNPVELGDPLILSNGTNSWSYSEALWNHKALLVDKSHNYLGFSLWRSNWTESNYSRMNDYILFDIDVSRKTPIQIKHTVNHYDFYKNNLSLYNSYYWWYYSFQIERAVRIDDYLYVISGEVITSHNLTGEFSTVDSILFERVFQEAYPDDAK